MIPKTIWQTWKSHNLPAEAAGCMASWKQANPGYQHVLMDDEECRESVRSLGDSELLEIYDRLPIPVMKADLWRYAIIYDKGGVYSDIDTTCRAPLDSWLPGDINFAVMNEGGEQFCQWTFAATARHPAMERVVRLLVERCRGPITMHEHAIHHYTGPSMFTTAMRAYAMELLARKDFSISTDATLLKAHGFYIYPPNHFRGTVVDHHFAGDLWSHVPGYTGWKNQVRGISKSTSMEKSFTEIYARDSWGKGSGPGSTPEYCAPFSAFLCDFINKNGIMSVCDLGCGDLAWMPAVIAGTNARYIGIDCVHNLISKHKERYAGNDRYEFASADLATVTSFPDADLYIIKDVLQHWPSSDVEQWMHRFLTVRPAARLLVVNCAGQPETRILSPGGFVPLDGHKAPLSAFGPVEVFSWRTKKVYEIRQQEDLRCLEIVVPEQGSLARIGRPHDGGYVVVDGIGEYDLFISGGLGDDISFERALLSMHPSLKCVAFDGSVAGVPGGAHPRMEWRKEFIGPDGADIRELLAGFHDVFLKIDIEGGEYWQLDAMTRDEMDRFKQIVVEFHNPYDQKMHVVQRLRETHDLVHVHANNYAPARRAYGAQVPSVFEATYVRKTIGAKRSKVVLPRAFDSINTPYAPDIVMRGYPWPL